MKNPFSPPPKASPEHNPEYRQAVALERIADTLDTFCPQWNSTIGEIRDILSRLVPVVPKARSLVAQIVDGGKVMGQPAQVHIDSTTAQQNAHEFDGPNGTGNPVAVTGPLAFSGDNDAVATIDPATGKITPVSLGVVNFKVMDNGALDASGVPLQDTNQVTIVSTPPPPPPKAQSLVGSIAP